ncbi:hypothetical protein Pan153_48500 [Gimesia panareensis]|uniref:Uncharacterized protein n=1 Tax=Gimesia panareensis TaxID=2527978 RepID=A0A518FV19_9PLAN|nr:hypothetical protein [Gimesia panareensis]QDV20178.1 hypothetical protein Pan153_48500 [Gimesia panareensis]
MNEVANDATEIREPDVPLRKRYVILLFLMAALFVGVPVVLVVALFLLPATESSSEPQFYEVADPGQDFTLYTGFAWPESARVVTAGEVRLEFLGDGEYYLVFDTDADTLARWLQQLVPWNQSTWQEGPVSEEIPRYFGFGVTGMSAPSAGVVTEEAIGEEQIQQALSSPETRYVARQRGQDSWNNGEILLLDPRHNRVWYSRWDL